MTCYGHVRPARIRAAKFILRAPRVSRTSIHRTPNRNRLSREPRDIYRLAVFRPTILNSSTKGVGELRGIVNGQSRNDGGRLSQSSRLAKSICLIQRGVFSSASRGAIPLESPGNAHVSPSKQLGGRVNILGPPGVRGNAKNSLTRVCRFVENRREWRNRRDLWGRTGACEERALLNPVSLSIPRSFDFFLVEPPENRDVSLFSCTFRRLFEFIGTSLDRNY